MSKLSIVLITLFLLNACTSNKCTSTSFINKSTENNLNVNLISTCPEIGVCKILIHKNKKIVLKKDGIGAQYLELTNGVNTVYEFIYKKGEDQKQHDGQESERILFQLNDESLQQLKDKQLKQIEAVYTKSCFCRGIAGTYEIEKGNYTLESDTVTLNFIIPKVGEKQIIKELKFKI